MTRQMRFNTYVVFAYHINTSIVSEWDSDTYIAENFYIQLKPEKKSQQKLVQPFLYILLERKTKKAVSLGKILTLPCYSCH